MEIQFNSLINKLPVLTYKARRVELSIYFGVFSLIIVAMLFTGVSYLRVFQRILAEQACPLPAAPSIINTQITITPDGTDGVVNCSSLDIIVGPTGEVVIERNVADDDNLSGDWGVTLLVNDLTIESGGKITADGQGYQTAEAESPGGDGGTAAGVTGGSGGGHGGAGGEGVEDGNNPAATPGIVYGNRETPNTLGSAGGNSGEGGLGGNGGGAIKIEATGNVDIDGEITADGDDGQAATNSSGGGGAGGSVWIEADTFSGSGVVSVNGGTADEIAYQGGGGGGGRIIMFCSTQNNFSGTVTASQGVTASSQDGGVGTVLGPTCKPDVPTILKMFKSDQVTELTVGDVTKESTVVFAADMSDVDLSDQLALQIELQPLGTPFTGVPNYTQSSNVVNPQECLAAPGDCGKIVATNLTQSREYHWQARIRDNKGGFSDWVSFGANAETVRDILLVGAPTSINIVSGNNQTGVVGQALVDPMIAKVVDTNGFGVPAVELLWQITGGGGSLGGTTPATTDINGLSSNTLTLGTAAGTDNQTVQVSNVGTPVTFTHSAEPDVAVLFIVDAPTVVQRNTNFSVTISAYDQYNNLATNYSGNPAISPYDPLDHNIALSGNLTPTSVSFTAPDAGTITVNNFNYDISESMAIKVDAPPAVGFSNAIAVVDSVGVCPDPDGIIDTGQTEVWDAGSVAGGVFDCSGIIIRVKDDANGNPTTLKLKSHFGDQTGATIIADGFIVSGGNFISADAEGFARETGPGSGGNDSQCAAAHGGYGQSNSALPYGDPRQPNTLGSGGCDGSYFGNISQGGDGGGGIKLETNGEIRINGTVSANGSPGTSNIRQGGTGSGGSVWLIANTINGTGLIQANGGVRSSAQGGGGGRIAVYESVRGTFPITSKDNIQAFGGGSGSWGGAGTIYIDADGVLGGNGDLWINNNGRDALSAGIPYDSVTPIQQFNIIHVKEYGHLRVLGIDSTLLITNEAGIDGDTSKPQVETEGLIDLPANFTIDSVTLDILGDIAGASNLTIGNTGTPSELILYGRTQKRQNSYGPNHDIYTNFNDVTVKSAGTITLIGYDGDSNSAGDNNAQNQDDYGVTLDISGTLDIQAAGTISADSTGYARNIGPGAGAATDGGSYGGFGDGNSALPYGSVKQPVDLGSGGRDGSYVGNISAGGPGGGAVKLDVAGTLTINGVITANGGPGTSNITQGGTGSGGSIFLIANQVDGSGEISADGGVRSSAHGGSGGRIAVYENTRGTFPITTTTNIHAFGGGNSTWGGPGTVYLDADGVVGGNGDLWVNNNGHNTYNAGIPYDPLNPIQEFNKIYVKEYGHLQVLGIDSTLRINSETGIEGDTSKPKIAPEGLLDLPATFAIDQVTLDIIGTISGANNLTIGDGSNPADIILYGHTQRRQQDQAPNQDIFPFANVTIKNAGTMQLVSYNGDANSTADDNALGRDDYGVNLEVSNDLIIETGGVITANSLGYARNVGLGTGGATSGGAHGGFGDGNTALPYGSVKEPLDLGSGGRDGSYVGNISAGGPGGGAIKLEVTGTLSNDGLITSIGGPGTSNITQGGTGAGGSIYLIANQIDGVGEISADGGTRSSAHGGSGGRIAIYETIRGTFPITNISNIHAFGGGTSNWGGPGTIYIDADGQVGGNGDLWVNNNNQNTYNAGIPYDAANPIQEFNKIFVKEFGHLQVLGINSTLKISSETGIEGDATKPKIAPEGLLDLPVTFAIDQVTLDVIGDISGGDNLTIGDGTNSASLNLYARTLKRETDLTPNQDIYSFNDITVKSASDLNLYSYDGDANSVDDNNASNLDDYGVTVNISNDLLVESNANINADGLGYRGGYGSNKGPGGGSGGAHGGYGQATSAAPYGDAYEPTTLGSRGGDCSYFGNRGNGGSSGGAIEIVVTNTATINGSISANGLNRTGSTLCTAGSGSGGSVLLNVGTLASAGSGAITANGGTDQNDGAGGRIAIYYTNSSFGITNETVQARGTNAGPGTIYIEHKGVDNPKGGNLYVDNNNVNSLQAGLVEDTYQFETINLTRHGKLDVLGQNSTLTLTSGASILGDATFPNLGIEGTLIYTGNTKLEIEGVDLDLKGDIDLVNNSNISLGYTQNSGLTLRANTWAHDNTTPYVFGNLEVGPQGVMTMVSHNNGDTDYSNDYGVYLQVANLTLDDTGVITADGTGYLNNAPGPGGGSGGASHGGYGQSSSRSTYGDLRSPITLGSSGNNCNYFGHRGYGGNGGGAMRIEVSNDATLNGIVSANGLDRTGSGLCTSGSGSGGSILLELNNLIGNGNGVIRANGGTSQTDGAGGRIAIYYASNTGFTLDKNRLQARGTNAGPGTIYYENTTINPVGEGSLLVDNNGVNGRTANLEAGTYGFDDIYFGSGVTAYVESDTNNNSGVFWNLAGDFTLEAGATIYGLGQGYASTLGPGAGENGLGQSGGAGGGYGGRGGDGESDGGNPVSVGGDFYGSQTSPLNLGSGGGESGAGAFGGAGGGAIAISARDGALNIHGTINMNGDSGKIASPGGGGGAGGSILLEGLTCDLTGNILAEGGNGGDEAFDGGGGGGGRVMILTTQGPCDLTGTVSVAQGVSAGGQNGQIGTFPGIATIPAKPDFQDQFKTDGATNIPVGGTTQEQEVILKVNVSDPGADALNPISLRPQFEVVETTESYTGTGLTNGQVVNYAGGAPVVSQGEVSGLIPGGQYKWRARVVNVDDGIASDWAEFGSNSDSAADFVISTVADLTIIPNKTQVEIGEPITLTVSAVDGSNSVDPTYNGTVSFSSTSGTAVLPVNYIFGSGDSGTHVFTDQLIFTEAGTYTVTVTDILNGSLTATTTNITVNAAVTPTPTSTDTPTPTSSPSPSVTTTGSPVPTNSMTPTATPTTTIAPSPTLEVDDCQSNPNTAYCQQAVEILNVVIAVNQNKNVKICWDTNIETIGYIEYGKANTGVYTDSTDVETEYIDEGHCMVIPGLESATGYIFRIIATSEAGKQADHDDTFATKGGTKPEKPKPDSQCIITKDPAFNAQGEVVINYQTIDKAKCTLYYGHSSSSMPFSSQSVIESKLHIGSIRLKDLNGSDDIIYKIVCSVDSKKDEDPLECSTNGVIPASRYGIYYTEAPITNDEEFNLLDFIGTVGGPGALLTIFLGLNLANFLAYPRLVLYAIGWIKDRKRYNPWGVIYQIVEGKRTPVPFAAVRMYLGNVFIKEKITDLNGRYGLPADKGEYRIEVEHSDFKKVEVTIKIDVDDGAVTEDIEMIPRDSEKAESLQWKKSLRQKLHKINTGVVYVGFVSSILITIFYPVLFNFIIVGLYVLQFVFLKLLEAMDRRDWGYIYSTNSGQRLEGAFIRLFDPKQARQIDVQISDEKGRFGFAPEKGQYRLSADSPGYKFPSVQTSKSRLVKTESGQQFLNIDNLNADHLGVAIPVDPGDNKTNSPFS